jgi:hypothetical protein
LMWMFGLVSISTLKAGPQANHHGSQLMSPLPHRDDSRSEGPAWDQSNPLHPALISHSDGGGMQRVRPIPSQALTVVQWAHYLSAMVVCLWPGLAC